MEKEYSKADDAALALLRDATQILKDSHVEFVVVGGWVPVLFHSKRFGHPGTYDADILLNSRSLEDGTVESAGERFLQDGYLRAVKNKFQAHRIIRVSGEDLVFHVDFLNEHHAGNELDLVGGKGKLQSIYTPAMEAIFKYARHRTHPLVDGVLFPSAETFIASKALATLVKKRNRDAFDVFVTAADQELSSFKARWRELMFDGLFRDANHSLWQAIHGGDALEKIAAILDDLQTPLRPSEEQILSAFDFLVPLEVGGR